MSALVSLQWSLRRALLGGDTTVAAQIRGDDRLERLAVYQSAYRLRLEGVLREDFPGLAQQLGDAAFGRLSADYARDRPSRHPSVRWFGAALAHYLDSTPPWEQRPELAEMARLEWQLGLAFDAQDQPALSAAALAELDAEGWAALALRLRRCVTRLRLRHNVGEQRRALDHGAPVPQSAPLPAIQHWAVWRRELIVHYRCLDADEAALFSALETGTGFTACCEQLAQQLEPTQVADQVPQRAATLLRRWLDEAWLAAD